MYPLGQSPAPVPAAIGVLQSSQNAEMTHFLLILLKIVINVFKKKRTFDKTGEGVHISTHIVWIKRKKPFAYVNGTASESEHVNLNINVISYCE